LRGAPACTTAFAKGDGRISLGAEFAASALKALGQYQAMERDDYRDALLGKILKRAAFAEKLALFES
jgi:hypothetical protein